MKTFTRLFTLIVALGLVGACNRDADVEEDVDVPPATEVTPAQAVRVTEVELSRSIGTDNRPDDNLETDEFAPMDTIYATVGTEGIGSGTLQARWTFEDGQVVDETTSAISPTGPTITEFHISKPDGFPVGKYKVEILLNNASVQSKDFEVKRSR